MILSDRDIWERVNAGSLGISPFNREHVQPASYDFCLGGSFLPPAPPPARDSLSRIRAAFTTPQRPIELAEGEVYRLRPREFVLGCTVERVTIPADLCAQVDGRSTWGRTGVLVHVTAGFIDPGFTGIVTLEIANLSPHTVELPVGARIGQFIFHTLSSPCERPYSGRYQGASTVEAAKA